MIIRKQVEYVLEKYPESKYNRADFAWHYGEEFYEFKIYCLKHQFKEFIKDWSAVERELRDALKKPEFKLKPEIDQKRYEKAEQFKIKYKKMSEK